MKKGVIYVNTARGALADEAALIAALKSGHIRHAGLDVFHNEPLPPTHTLAKLDNVTLSLSDSSPSMTAVAGESGSGKTTLARMMLGFINPSLGGVLYAAAVYWLGGGLLYGAARRFGSLGSYRRSRSLVALSGAPLALALFTLWPLRIAIYGENLFRTGGDDWGPGDRIFGGVLYLTFVWSAVLLVIGVRSVHGWTWGRSLATVGLAAALPALLVLAKIA